MNIRYYFSALILCLSAVVGAQSFEFQAPCDNPNNGQGDPPQLIAAVKLDGQNIPDGTLVGVFDMNGGLLGVVGVYLQDNNSGPDYSAVNIVLQTRPNNTACDSFLAPEVVQVRLQQGNQSIIADNGTFAGTTYNISTLTILNGPDQTSTFDTLQFSSAALPVTLANFSATPNRNKVDLTWSTSSETENSYFEVQRSTTPDGGFQNIGKVLGNETTTEFNTYEFTDNNPAEGTNYYRLKQFDFDGTTNFSPIVVADIAVSAERSVAVYPNPIVAGGRVTVRLNGNWTAGGANLQLVDANGRKVADWNGLSNGSLNTELPVVKAGIYQLIATDGKERKATRVIVH